MKKLTNAEQRERDQVINDLIDAVHELQIAFYELHPFYVGGKLKSLKDILIETENDQQT